MWLQSGLATKLGCNLRKVCITVEHMSEAQLKARDRHLAHVHSLLSSYGITWSASKVLSLVKRYENEPHDKYTIDEYLHRALFAHALTDRCPTTRPVINYRDKTGEDAVYWVLKKQMRG